MKKLYSFILVAILIFTFVPPVQAAGAMVETLEATATTNSIKVSGTTSNDIAAVMVEVLKDRTSLAYYSLEVSANKTFSGTISGLNLTTGSTYTVRAADYDGGIWKTVSVTVPATGGSDGENSDKTDVADKDGSDSAASNADSSNSVTDATSPAKDISQAAKGQTVETKDTKATYMANGDGTVTYVAPTSNKSKKVTVPATVTDASGNKVKVTAVAPLAFKGNKKVTAITVGMNVTTVGANAFSNCKNLKKITLGSKVTKIGKNVFKGDSKLKTITITSKKIKSSGITKGAFSGLTGKTTIKVPSGRAKEYKKIFQKKGLSKKVKVK